MPLGPIKLHRDTRETSSRRPFSQFFCSISKESTNPLPGVAQSYYMMLGGHKARGWHTKDALLLRTKTQTGGRN